MFRSAAARLTDERAGLLKSAHGAARRAPMSPINVSIAIMAKAPVAGLAKTRLAPALGLHGAATLAARLLAHAVAEATAAALGPVTLWATPDLQHPAFAQARRRHGVQLALQPEGDLGQRMAAVFDARTGAAAPTLLMGSDAPALTAALLREAAARLKNHDAVFVPALDGGYALVGLRAAKPVQLRLMFGGMVWSTPQVMAQTRQRLQQAGLRFDELPPVADIDEPADLVHLPHGWTARGLRPPLGGAPS